MSPSTLVDNVCSFGGTYCLLLRCESELFYNRVLCSYEYDFRSEDFPQPKWLMFSHSRIRATCAAHLKLNDFTNHAKRARQSLRKWKVLNLLNWVYHPIYVHQFLLLLLHSVGIPVTLEGVGRIFASNLYNGLDCHSEIKCQYAATPGVAVANLSIRRLTSL